MKSLVGTRANDLVVTSEEGPRHGVLVCMCVCGKSTMVKRAHFLSGNTKSCGCLRVRSGRVRFTAHGAKADGQVKPSYRSWQMMKNRCLNPHAEDWKYYGGRGITICKNWADYSAFIADMGEPLLGQTIERVNTNGNYEPNNCIWADRQTQARNREYCVEYTFEGETFHTWEWATKLGIKLMTFYQRVWKHNQNKILFPYSGIFKRNLRKCV